MIATDHQYRVTQERLGKFRDALKALIDRASSPDSIHAAQTLSIKEQIEALEASLSEYERLLAGGVKSISVSNLLELPVAIIKARIARGLTQSDLAEILGLKAQQVQRWESEKYSNVSFARLAQIAEALKLAMPQNIVLEGAHPRPPSVARRAIISSGLPREVFERVIVPRSSPAGRAISTDAIDARTQILLGTNIAALQAGKLYSPRALRFKLPSNAAEQRTRAYAAYIDGLCSIVGKCLPASSKALPSNWRELANLLFSSHHKSLKSAIQACWHHNIAVIALDDPVAFHGACWRRSGRAVVVLKQPVRSEVRWLFDLIHELFHIIAAPEGDFAVLETGDEQDRQSQEEKRANRFAALLLTDGRLQELTDAIISYANGATPKLKSATKRVAKETGFEVGLLAGLLAQRLSENPENESWWATATSLQNSDELPWQTTNELFLANARIGHLEQIEKDIIFQLMEPSNAG